MECNGDLSLHAARSINNRCHYILQVAWVGSACCSTGEGSDAFVYSAGVASPYLPPMPSALPLHMTDLCFTSDANAGRMTPVQCDSEGCTSVQFFFTENTILCRVYIMPPYGVFVSSVQVKPAFSHADIVSASCLSRSTQSLDTPLTMSQV